MISRFLQQGLQRLQSPSLAFQARRRLGFLKRGEKSEILPDSLKDVKEFEANRAEFENPVHRLVQPGKEKLIGFWLLFTSGTVFFMVVLGGYTRLSGSGLSMTRWKPIDASMPSSEEKWEEEFSHYKKFPEYQLVNKEMSLEGFKKIFFVEWFHRAVGSSLGLIFGVPLSIFLYKGYLKTPMKIRLFLLLALGGSQGLIGWWMVRSGMDKKPDYQSKPRVSVYRLFVHLNNAVLIYSILFWNALTLLRKPQEALLAPQNLAPTLKARKFGILLVHLIAFNIMSGACAAGIDAMKVYNDWPFYNGQIIPSNLLEKSPAWKNFFENKALVQFNHRNLGYATTFFTYLMLFKTKKIQLMKNQKLSTYLVGGIVTLQVANGITTLMHNTPPHEANIHQLNALLVLSSTLYMLHTCRNPSLLYSTYLRKFI